MGITNKKVIDIKICQVLDPGQDKVHVCMVPKGHNDDIIFRPMLQDLLCKPK